MHVDLYIYSIYTSCFIITVTIIHLVTIFFLLHLFRFFLIQCQKILIEHTYLPM